MGEYPGERALLRGGRAGYVPGAESPETPLNEPVMTWRSYGKFPL